MMYFAVILGIVSVIAVAVVIYLVVNSSTKLIANVAFTLKGIGDGDLTKRLSLEQKNAIGDMARYFDLTLTKISKMVGSTQKTTEWMFGVFILIPFLFSYQELKRPFLM